MNHAVEALRDRIKLFQNNIKQHLDGVITSISAIHDLEVAISTLTEETTDKPVACMACRNGLLTSSIDGSGVCEGCGRIEIN